jgi:hypothetical protein
VISGLKKINSGGGNAIDQPMLLLIGYAYPRLPGSGSRPTERRTKEGKWHRHFGLSFAAPLVSHLHPWEAKTKAEKK